MGRIFYRQTPRAKALGNLVILRLLCRKASRPIKQTNAKKAAPFREQPRTYGLITNYCNSFSIVASKSSRW